MLCFRPSIPQVYVVMLITVCAHGSRCYNIRDLGPCDACVRDAIS